MRRVVWTLSLLGALVYQAPLAIANHLDCARAWPGTPTEANQAWAACKAQDAQEHVQMLKYAQQRQAEERARQAAEQQRQEEQQYQRAMEERRVRALEEAAQAQQDANRPRTCVTVRQQLYPWGLETRCN